MKVIDKRPQSQTVELGSLDYGDCFFFPDELENLCMRVMTCTSQDGYCAFVDFENDEVNDAYYQVQVIPVVAEITIVRNK